MDDVIHFTSFITLHTELQLVRPWLASGPPPLVICGHTGKPGLMLLIRSLVLCVSKFRAIPGLLGVSLEPPMPSPWGTWESCHRRFNRYAIIYCLQISILIVWLNRIEPVLGSFHVVFFARMLGWPELQKLRLYQNGACRCFAV